MLSFESNETIAQHKSDVEAGKNPRDVKFALAMELIERFHDKAAAEAALAGFKAQFQKGAIPDDIDEMSIQTEGGSMGIAHILKQAGLCPSTSEAIRMVKQGAVKINGEKVADPKSTYPAGTEAVYQVGKRKFAKIKLT